ncbi:MAG: hypothetical protein H0X35_14500, partial [Pseudonocardiales bacterium]|nr:hypothetical protein [Pseudonocardiales bacterium]
MDVSAAEIRQHRWLSRAKVGVVLAAIAMLAGVVFSLIPFDATPSRPNGAATVDCGRPLAVLRSNDPGPGLRRFFNGGPTLRRFLKLHPSPSAV